MTQLIQPTACASTSRCDTSFVGSFVRAQALLKELIEWKILKANCAFGTGQVFGRDNADTRTLGIVQLMILNRIKADPENATARKITDDLSKIFGERIPDAQVFVTLSRLRDRGLVNAANPENPSTIGDKTKTTRSPALPSKSTAQRRGRRAAIMQLTPEGVSAVEQAAAQIRLSASATKSLKGDRDDTTTTNAAEAATLG